MAVKVHWKFHNIFKELYLDIWYEMDRESWNQAFHACDKVGNDMVTWNIDHNPLLNEKVYEKAIEETQEEIIASRLG